MVSEIVSEIESKIVSVWRVYRECMVSEIESVCIVR